MPPLETMDLIDTALLWTVDGVDRYGKYKRSTDYVELSPTTGTGVRWVNVVKEVQDKEGNTIKIDAEVVVTLDIDIGSTMWLGGEADIPDGLDEPNADLMKVVVFNKTEDLKGLSQNTRRTVSLVRISNTIPTAGD